MAAVRGAAIAPSAPKRNGDPVKRRICLQVFARAAASPAAVSIYSAPGRARGAVLRTTCLRCLREGGTARLHAHGPPYPPSLKLRRTGPCRRPAAPKGSPAPRLRPCFPCYGAARPARAQSAGKHNEGYATCPPDPVARRITFPHYVPRQKRTRPRPPVLHIRRLPPRRRSATRPAAPCLLRPCRPKLRRPSYSRASPSRSPGRCFGCFSPSPSRSSTKHRPAIERCRGDRTSARVPQASRPRANTREVTLLAGARGSSDRRADPPEACGRLRFPKPERKWGFGKRSVAVFGLNGPERPRRIAQAWRSRGGEGEPPSPRPR